MSAIHLTSAVLFFLSIAYVSVFRSSDTLVETLGIWAFSAYWIIKTFEMRESSAEKLALDAELRREVVAAPAGELGPLKSGKTERIVKK